MNWFRIIIKFIFCSIDVGVFIGFGQKYMSIKDIFKRYQVFFFTFSCIISIFAMTCITTFSTWKILLISFMLFIHIFILFESDIKIKILYLILFISITISCEILATAIVAYIKQTLLSTVLQSDMNRLIVYGIQKILFSLFFITCFHYKFTEDILLLPLNMWFAFLFSYSIVLSLVILFMNWGYKNGNSIFNTIPIIVNLAFIVVYFSIYYLFYQLCKYFKKSNESSLIEYQNEMIEKYILQKEESDKIVNILNHDLKHNLLLWNHIAKAEGLNEVLDDIEEYEKILETYRVIDTGNNIANVIVNQKLLYAKKNNIAFDIQGVIHEGLLLSSTELCSLLGNLIDNAIEATLKINETDQRKISLSVKRDKTFLFLEIENSYAEEPIIKNGKIITWKENRQNHGIGLISINDLVNKYGGAIDNTFNDHIFKSILMLRAYNF